MGEINENVCGTDSDKWDDVQKYIADTNLLQLGTYYSYMIDSDIKHLAFTLSRYKFASKLLMYKESLRVLELGCQEALGSLLFMQNNKLEKYVGVDMDKKAIEWNQKYLPKDLVFVCADLFECKELGKNNYNAVVSLDVIEHISSKMEDKYCEVIVDNLTSDGVAIVGTPSVMLSPYASEGSKIGHINLFDQNRLYDLMNKYFHNVFIFNMNDEVVNVGFAPMSCYIFAVCCNKK